MRITQWGEYGVHCAAFIAHREAKGSGPVGAQEISHAQGIALDYAQQILQRLRKGGIIDSVRGPQGGYKLARQPQTITLRDILIASEGDTFEVICDTKPLSLERCNESAFCALRDVWTDLKAHVDSFLITHTLETLVASQYPSEEPIQIGRATTATVQQA
jgi:Rrf2 family iron-sulfur cluster assembly transcriptional regulator